MILNDEVKKNINIEFEKKVFMKIFILLKKRKEELNVRLVAELLNINFNYFIEIVEKYKEYFEISLNGKEKTVNNMIILNNKKGESFFYNNIDSYF